MLKIENKRFTSTVYNDNDIERGRLGVYGELRRYLDKNPKLYLVKLKEVTLKSKIGGYISVNLDVTLKNYL